MKVRVGACGIALAILLAGSCAGQTGASAASDTGSSAVPVTIEVKSPRGTALGHVSIGIATGPNEPFSFYQSDAKGDVIVSLTPGEHDLRFFVHGYPMTYEHVHVSVPARAAVVLGHGTASRPATAVVQPQVERPSRTPARAAAQPPTRTPVEPAATSGGPDPLQAYTSCAFPDGLDVVSVKPMAAGPLLVATAAGTETIDPTAAKQVLFSYPLTDDFANAKVEELPADQYGRSKQILLDNLALMESQRNGPVRVEALPVGLHGFDVHGNNLTELEGNVLGMYLLFDDPHHVVTTVSFLNQHAWQRKFRTMDEYRRLRDQFLRTYTGCIRQNLEIESGLRAKTRPVRHSRSHAKGRRPRQSR